MIQHVVIREYHMELERAKLPGYASRYDDDYFDTPPQNVPAQPIHPPQLETPKPHFDKSEGRSSETTQVGGDNRGSKVPDSEENAFDKESSE